MTAQAIVSPTSVLNCVFIILSASGSVFISVFVEATRGIVQLLTVLLIFIFVLALTYFTTKLTAGFQKGRYQSANVEIIETLRIAPTKYIQIVRIGEKYYSYVVCKDTVTLLGELAKDDLAEIAKNNENTAPVSFKDIFEKLRK